MLSRTQHRLIVCLIAAIALAGLSGIIVLLRGTFGWLEVRVLMTTGAVAAATILGLAASVVFERGRWRPLGLIAAVCTVLALLMVLSVIWYDRPWMHRTYYQAVTSMVVLAVAFTHAGLLGFARLQRGWERVRWLTFVAVAVLVVLLLVIIWGEISGDGFFRFLGVVVILSLCGSLALPMLHRLTLLRRRAAVRSAPPEVRLHCPRCGRPETVLVGHGRCGGCGLGIHVEIEEEHCLSCGYPLFGLTTGVCPECGAPVAAAATSA